MSLNPSIVVADNVLVVEAREECHLALDAAKLLTGRIDLDSFHSIVAAIQLVLDLYKDGQPQTQEPR